MTKQDVVDEIMFIHYRGKWLYRQLRDGDGMLLSRDLREECSMLYRRLEELEKLYHAFP